MKMQSHDVTGSNIDKIAKLFPQCVTEHKNKDGKTVLGIDFEKLRNELSADVIDEARSAISYVAGQESARTLGEYTNDKDASPLSQRKRGL